MSITIEDIKVIRFCYFKSLDSGESFLKVMGDSFAIS